MKNRIASLVVFASLCLAGSAHSMDSIPAPVEVVSATVDPVYDSLLAPRKRGWLGADGASSIRLDDQKSLWIFGDTILGTIVKSGDKKGPMVRNSIGVHDRGNGLPGTVDFYWDFSDRLIGDFFHPESFAEEIWYWPAVGTMIDGELFVFLMKLQSGPGPAGFGFDIIDLTVCRISNPFDCPESWDMTYIDLGLASSHQGFFSAIFVESPYLYLLGYDDGPKDNPAERRAVLARVPAEDFKKDPQGAAFEFCVKGETGPRWSGNRENLEPLFSPGVTESSLQYVPSLKQYLCVTYHAFEPGMYVVTSPALTGPWSDPIKVYEVPDLTRDETFHAYAMKAHPELAAASDEVVITYVVNTKDSWAAFTDPTIYYPRFVRVILR